MKIGILTFQNTNNFGATLQVYALFSTIKKLGFEIEIINYYNEVIDSRESPAKFEAVFLKNPKRLLCHFLFEPILSKKHKKLRSFLRENCKISSTTFDCESKLTLPEYYDAVIIGSDQVWNLSLISNDMTYLGDFNNGQLKLFTYGVSSGKELNKKEIEIIAPYLEKFECYYVREEKLKEQIKHLVNKDVKVVADPTALLAKDDWEKYIESHHGYSKYVFVYFYDKKLLSYAKAYAKKNNLKLIVVSYGCWQKGYKTVRPTSIGEFLSFIYHADTVFTGSYHGLLFSIYFHKDFYAYSLRNTDRMEYLLSKLDIANRKICPEAADAAPIQWGEVDKKMKAFREESIEALAEALGGCK